MTAVLVLLAVVVALTAVAAPLARRRLAADVRRDRYARLARVIVVQVLPSMEAFAQAVQKLAAQINALMLTEETR